MKFLCKLSAYTLFFISIFSFNDVYAQNLHETEGFASYYADDFHGKRTANGEIYDMHKLTAAHPYLPFNTWIKVTNVANNKTVTVRINDRGPFARNRIIDMSLAAARILGMLGPGSIYVRLEMVNPPIETSEDKSSVSVPELESNEIYLRFRSKPVERTSGGTISDYGLYNSNMEKVNSKGFVVQLASYSELRSAKLYLDQIDDISSNELFIQYSDNGKYRIVVGIFKNRDDAEKKKNQIQNHHPGCFVLTLR
ncbi:MAG: septal ring lytic transglycosylase RlpA family protein [Bacteroidetes bacterium]|nr:septal ring lytic transglycosylase RlpA family protein [Bacteroidota bacterium]MBU2583695.1 septal ring lytic transglycosylase RlpA family protein [Bacteroidota bacterium]